MKKILLFTIFGLLVLSTTAIPQTGNCNLNGYTTFTQGGWGNPSNSVPGGIRDQYFGQVFPGGLIIGSGTKTIKLTSAQAVQNFLPQGSGSSALTQSYIDPTDKNITVFAGQAVALTMNVFFDLYGAIGASPTKLGSLVIVSGSFSGKTVNQLLSLINIALAGGNTGYALSDLNDAATKINENFDNGTVNKNYLTCPIIIQKASIGDKVWKDVNKNGIQDSGESGFSGVTVSLYNCSNNFISSTTTNTYGNYSFSNLTPGDYYVKFDLPSNYVFSPKNSGSNASKDSDADLLTGKTICTTLTSGENDVTWDAGMYLECKNTIGDFVWHDINVNGIQDANEPGIQNVVVELYTSTGTLISSSTTDANGKYEFTQLANGTYKVKVAASNYTTNGILSSSAQTKWYATKKDQGSDDSKDNDAIINGYVTVTLNCGDNKTVDFGFYYTSIKITKTADKQTVNAGEVVTYNFVVENTGDIQHHGGAQVTDALVGLDTNFVLNAHATSTFTRSYKTKVSNCGTLVNTVVAVGHPVDGSASVSHSASATVEVLCKASLGDKVWNDTNKNGIQDNGEAGIANVTVKLYSCDNVLKGTTTTDANGLYSFTNLIPGDYYVQFVVPSGYTISPAIQGGNTSLDSNPDATGKTACITLTSAENNLTVDAGMYPTPPAVGSLGDKVWNDTNHNGIQDNGEIGIANVTVELHKCSDNSLVATTTTNANGVYLFNNLIAADYYVQFAVTSGYAVSPALQGSDVSMDSNPDATGKTACITLTAGENNLTIDAGMFPVLPKVGSLGDKVWNDTNHNGIQDVNEVGIPNVTVELHKCSDNSLVAITTTNANGGYLFSNFAVGDYYVQFVVLTGYTVSPSTQGGNTAVDSNPDATGKTACISLAVGENNLTVDAGMYLTPVVFGSLGDFVWNDTNNNGIQDLGENGIPNVTVELRKCSDNCLVATTTTNATGKYLFSNFAIGDYYVQFVVLTGYTVSPSLQGGNSASDSNPDSDGKTACISLAIGENNLTIDAGMHSTPPAVGSIGDLVWNDANHNGLQDVEELGIPNVTVELHKCSDNSLIASTTTNESGGYLFDNLAAGDYYVQFTLPQGYAFTSKDVFANGRDLEDSDADLTTGKTGCTTLTEGEINLSLDAGMFQLKASLGDKVWNDLNKDGIQDANENGIQGIVVTLYNCSGTLVSTATTDANGEYFFTNLLPGDYKVNFALPSTYLFSSENQGFDDLKDSDADGTTGFTSCVTLAGGENNLSVDAGMYVKEVTMQADLSLTKSVDKLSAKNGDVVTFTVTVSNNGPNNATNVSAKDFLTTGFTYSSAIASQGSYNQTTGMWTIGTIASGNNATLTIACIVNVSTPSASAIDLGPAKGYNVFVLKDVTQPSADTEGKMAVGQDAHLANYSVGDKLPASSGTVDALIVGRNLSFTSGSIYGGNVVFGNSSNLPIYPVSYVDGTLRQDSPIDFSAAATYLQNLSAQLSVYPANGTTIMQWGAVHMTGTDPYMNVFTVNGADLSSANNVVIGVPNGSVVLVNVTGQTITWSGGFSVNGTAITNVLYNFFEATSIRIQGINVTGSILAPSADVNFVSGVQNGQLMCKSLEGRGQFNNVQFMGNIPSPSVLPNVAEVMFADQIDPDSAPGNGVVTEDDYASVFVTILPDAAPAQTQGWNLISSLNNSSTILSMTSDKNNTLITGTLGGKIYRNTASVSEVINQDMDVKTVWSVNANNEIMILAGTEKGLFASEDNGTTWQLLGLDKKDVRSIVVDAYGTMFAATWGEGLYVSKNGGTDWSQANKGLENLNIQSILLVNNQLIAATYGGGIYRSVDNGNSWIRSAIDCAFIWNLTASPNGILYAATYGNGVYKSEDNGMNWLKLGKNLKADFIYSISADKNETVYASSLSSGMFGYSITSGDWQVISLPKEEVSSLYVNSDDAVAYAGTKNGTVYSISKKATSVEDKKIVPTEYSLSQNYPNPFNPTTTIQFSVAQTEQVKIVVYNMLGEEVVTLFNEVVNPGNFSIPFNASTLASGMYIYRLSSPHFTMTKKMMLLK